MVKIKILVFMVKIFVINNSFYYHAQVNGLLVLPILHRFYINNSYFEKAFRVSVRVAVCALVFFLAVILWDAYF